MTTPALDYGVVQLVPVKAFVESTREFNEAYLDPLREFTAEEPEEPRSIGGWPRIQRAILRRGLYVIEAEAPSFARIMLHFAPEKPDAGDYELHPRMRGRLERGRTTRVTLVADGDISYPVLARFPTRYRVLTVASERPYTRLVWFVGLTHFHTASGSDETNGEAAQLSHCSQCFRAYWQRIASLVLKGGSTHSMDSAEKPPLLI